MERLHMRAALPQITALNELGVLLQRVRGPGEAWE
jgi:hypothetical protein